MRFCKIKRRRPTSGLRPTSGHPRVGSGTRQLYAIAATLTLLASAGCSPPRPPVGVEGFLPDFLGAAIADEPRAAIAGRDVLSAGGSAADAAVAVYFMLAVTYPSAAGLGGGGACVVYNGEKKQTDSIEFLPRVPANGGPLALPGNVRGMAALHARHGRLRWETLLSAAELTARTGHPTSRAFARRIEANRNLLAADPRLAERFGRREGDPLAQPELAGLLGQLRVRGGGDFYVGEAAKAVMADFVALGGTASADELRVAPVNIATPISFPVGNHVGLLPPGPVGGERFQRLWRTLTDSAYRRTAAEQQPKLLADAVAAAYVDLGGPLGVGERGSTGFVVTEADGSAVACALTMHRDFGARRIGRQTGILFAAPPTPDANGAPYLSPFLVVNINTRQVFFAGSPAGAGAGLPALAAVAADAIVGEVPLDKAVASPRLVAAGPAIGHEPGFPPGSFPQSEGRQVTELPSLGRVNVVYCYDGLRRNPKSCSFATDARGFGLVADRAVAK
jgi:gamma-glutamyltranspeptidase / glutathione hydrolase